MELVDLKYYVLAMYDQTLFLGQAVVGGALTLELSTLKLYSDTPSTATPSHCYPLDYDSSGVLLVYRTFGPKRCAIPSHCRD